MVVAKKKGKYLFAASRQKREKGRAVVKRNF